MNICIFSRDFYPSIGGLERIAQILAAQAARMGHSVEVVTDTPGSSSACDQDLPFRITRTSEYQVRVRAFNRADAVLFMNVSLHGMLPAFATGIPVIFSHHGVYHGSGVVGNFLELLKRQLTRFFPNIAVSHFVAHNIPGSSVVIHNSYDNTLFKQPNQRRRARDFVFCGRLVSDKGADICLSSFACVMKSEPSSTLTIVGDGPARTALQTMARSLGIADQVRFTGSLIGHDLANELQRHACMLVPSLWDEPFGIVALEGIACCDTLIVSCRGGLPEAAGPCGIVIEPTVDNFSSVMLAVVRARRDGALLPGQPSEGVRQAHLARHTPEGVTQRYLAVIDHALSFRMNRGIR